MDNLYIKTNYSYKQVYCFIDCLYWFCCIYWLSNIYYINTSEIPSELPLENLISSHVKITCYLHTWRDHRLHNKSRPFYWFLYNKQNITCPGHGYEFYRFVFNSISHSFAALIREISSWTFISTPGHVIIYISSMNHTQKPK